MKRLNMAPHRDPARHSVLPIRTAPVVLLLFVLASTRLSQRSFAEDPPTPVPTNTPTYTPTCTFLPTSTPWPCEDGMVTEGFENDCSGWTFCDYVAGSASCQEGIGLGGSYALQIEVEEGDAYAGAVKQFAVIPGHDYKVEAWFYEQRPVGSSAIYAEFIEADCNECSCPTSSDIPSVPITGLSEGEWVKKTIHLSVTLNTSVACLRFYGGYRTLVRVDDVELTDLDPPACTPTPTPTCTFLPTSTPWPCTGITEDFEGGTCDLWSFCGSAATPVVCPAVDNNCSPNGSFSLKMIPDFRGWCGVSRVFEVIPGHNYKVEGWFCGDEVVDELKAEFAEARCNECWCPDEDDKPSVNVLSLITLKGNTWKKATIHESVTINTGRACLRIYYSVGPEYEPLWIDDFVLTDLDGAACTPTSTPTPTGTPWQITTPTPLLKNFHFIGDEDSDGGRDVHPK